MLYLCEKLPTVLYDKLQRYLNQHKTEIATKLLIKTIKIQINQFFPYSTM